MRDGTEVADIVDDYTLKHVPDRTICSAIFPVKHMHG